MATFFLLIIYITFIGLGLPDSLLGSAWPLMRLDFGMPLDSAGIATMIISGGTIISSLLSEKLIRRFKTGPVTAVSVMLTAGALLGISFAPSFAWILLLAVPLGLGAGAVDAALNNYVAVHYKAHHMNFLHSFWGVGAFCGPLIIAGFLQQGSWRGGYLTIAVIQMGITALLFITLPLWKKMDSQSMSEIQEKRSREDAPPPAKNALRIPGVSLALLSFLFYCATESSVGLWGSSYLVEGRGMTQAAAARGISLFYMGITVGRFCSGFLSVRLKSRQLIRLGISLIFVGAVLFVLPLPAGASLVALVLIGLGCAPVYPNLIHETPRNFGVENSQKVVGLQMAFAYVGSTFVPPVVGLVATRVSVMSIPWFPLLFSLLMLAFTEGLSRVVARQRQNVRP